MNGVKRLSLTVWRSLTSAQLTVLLNAALLVALAIASLLPQLPPDSAVLVPSQRLATLGYRQTTRLIQLLALFEAFRAPWYPGLVAGLLLNLVACNAQRLSRTRPFLARPPNITGTEEFYLSHVRRQEWSVCSLQEGLEAVTRWSGPARAGAACTPSLMNRPRAPISLRCGAVGANEARW
jgi:hypothetical protein